MVINSMFIRQTNDDAKEMMWFFHKDPKKCEWLHVREPKDQDNENIHILHGKETLTLKLQRNIGYDVKAIHKLGNKHVI